MQPKNIETIEYKPNKALGLSLVAIHGVTSAILIWFGMILGPDHVASMDGVNRILFTVVSIRFFSWSTAAIFIVLAILIGLRTLRCEPTLTITSGGGSAALH